MKTRSMLVANLAIGLLVLIAHGGAYLLIKPSDALNLQSAVSWLPISIFASLGIIISSAFAIRVTSSATNILLVQCAVFSIGGLILGYWAISLLLQPPNSDARFSWGVGIFTALMTYATYLFRQVYLQNLIERSSIVKNIHIIVGSMAFLVDIAVFMKVVP